MPVPLMPTSSRPLAHYTGEYSLGAAIGTGMRTNSNATHKVSAPITQMRFEKNATETSCRYVTPFRTRVGYVISYTGIGLPCMVRTRSGSNVASWCRRFVLRPGLHATSGDIKFWSVQSKVPLPELDLAEIVQRAGSASSLSRELHQLGS